MERVNYPYKMGYYTIKKYPLKTDLPIKITYAKKAVREVGWEKSRKVKIIDFKEPVYFTEFGEKEPIYFGLNLKDRIYEFEQELKHNVYDHKLDNNLIRSKSKLFEYALCNEFEYFVTLTIDEKLHDRYDLTAYKKKLGKFLNNYKMRGASDIKYVLVPEFHSDGAVHMHGLISDIPKADLKRNEHGYLDWTPYSSRFGYFSCAPIRDYERCAKYITKYITKDLKSMPKGSQIIMCSKGLQTAEVLDKGFDEAFEFENPDFENDFVKIAWINDGN